MNQNNHRKYIFILAVLAIISSFSVTEQQNPTPELLHGTWVFNEPLSLSRMDVSSLQSGISVALSANDGNAMVDDFRVHPISSQMNTYVYNAFDELTHIMGPNILATKYTYDAMGRLISKESEVEDLNAEGSGGFKKTAENTYTYKY